MTQLEYKTNTNLFRAMYLYLPRSIEIEYDGADTSIYELVCINTCVLVCVYVYMYMCRSVCFYAFMFISGSLLGEALSSL